MTKATVHIPAAAELKAPRLTAKASVSQRSRRPVAARAGSRLSSLRWTLLITMMAPLLVAACGTRAEVDAPAGEAAPLDESLYDEGLVKAPIDAVDDSQVVIIEPVALSAGPVPVPPWETTTFVDHPLVGKVWSTAREDFVTPQEALASLTGAMFVMLGEKHDSPDHHRLQTWLLSSMIDAGRRPAVAFEQMTTDQEDVLYDHLAVSPRDASGIQAAIGWDESGWPEWAMYEPLADAALSADLPIVPANPPRDVIMAIAGMGEPLDAATMARLGLDVGLPAETRAALEAEIVESHCGYLPADMAPPMADAQRARDGGMAERISRAALELPVDGVILITGNGHARMDRGVPWHLERLVPGATVGAIGILEVVEGREDPAAYAEDFDGTLPYDFIWFTPRVDDIDPCEKFAEELQRMSGDASPGADDQAEGTSDDGGEDDDG